ncbi:MAG: Ig-like domain-containing protein, partial [Pseudomonadota bacterium]
DDGPVALVEDTIATGTVLTNDSDADGDALTVTGFTVPGLTGPGAGGSFGPGDVATIPGVGTFTLDGAGTYTFTPAADVNGVTPPVITYTVDDGSGTANATATATLTFGAIAAVNDNPVASADAFTVVEDAGLATLGNVITGDSGFGSDSDGDGDALVVASARVDGDGDGNQDVLVLGTPTLITNANGPVGTVTLAGDGTISFAPAANYNSASGGSVPVITYDVSDGAGGLSSATITLDVTAVNDAPQAGDDFYIINEDAVVFIDPRTNDSDADGDGLTITQIDGQPVTPGGAAVSVANGSVALTAGGILQFTPDANYTGTLSFTHTVDDGTGAANATDVATITIQVDPVNDAPQAGDDGFVTAEDTAVTIVVGGNDSDVDGDTLTVTEVDGQAIVDGGAAVAVANGTVALVGGDLVFTPAANFNSSDGGPGGGPVSFTYTVDDGSGAATATATATVTGTVTSVNDAPVAVADTASGVEDGGSVTQTDALTGSVLSNDGDGDGDVDALPLTVTGFTVAGMAGPLPGGGFALGTPVAVTDGVGAVGSLTVNGDGTFTFTPAANWNGTVPVITYTADDGTGAANSTSTATLTITIASVNDAPAAGDDTFITDEDVAVTIPVLTNDSDPEGAALTVVAVDGQPILDGGPAVPVANGTVALVAGELVFTPNANFNSDNPAPGGGPVTFTYTVDDGTPGGNATTATVTGTVTSINDVPLAVDDSITTNEDTPVTILVTANDSDPDGDPLTITQVDGQPIVEGGADVPVTNGVVTLVGGDLIFTPDANVNTDGTAPITFTYTVEDPAGMAATATIDVTVLPVNDDPVATINLYAVAEDATLSANVLGDDTGAGIDSDPDGDALSVTGFTLTGEAGPFLIGTPYTITDVGDVTLDANGDLTFVPLADYNSTSGPALPQLTYTVSDGNGGTSSATVDITVTAVNDLPIATPDTASAIEDGPVISGNFLTNDSDPEGAALVVGVATVDIDGDGLQDALTLGTPANILNATGDPVGQLQVNADGTFTFAPGADFNGVAPIVSYSASDGDGGIAISTLTITVTPQNDVPVAVDDGFTTPEETAVTIPVVPNDTDIDGDALTVTSVDGQAISDGGAAVAVANGTVALIGGELVFTPAVDYVGAATFTYTVDDGNTGTATAIVTGTVSNVNDAPVAQDDTFTLDEDGTVLIPVTTNDTDVDGDTLTVTQVDGQPIVDAGAAVPVANGTVALLGGNLVFTPDADFNTVTGGPVAFTYTVDDGNAGTATATVTGTVNPVNDAPIAENDAANGSEDGPAVTVDALTNDSDIDGDTLSVTQFTIAGEAGPFAIGVAYTINGVGSVLVEGTGLFTFTPAADFNGTVPTISYTMNDGNGLDATADVVFTIDPVNDAPLATVNAYTVAEAGTVTGNIITDDTGVGADSDVDGDVLSVTQFTIAGVGGVQPLATPVALTGSNGAIGTLTVNGDGTFTFVGAADYNTAADGPLPTILYTVDDGNGGSAQAALQITVTAVNDGPVATDDALTTDEDTVLMGNVIATDNGSGIDGDVDGDPLTVVAATVDVDGSGTQVPLVIGTPTVLSNAVGPVGTLTLQGDGGFTFDPATHYNTSVGGPVPAVTYTVSDPDGEQDSATLMITVAPVNDAPRSVDDNRTVDEDVATPLNVTLPTDIDDAASALTVLINQVPSAGQGTVTYTADGGGLVTVTPFITLSMAELATLTFTGAPDYTGPVDPIQYVAFDDDGEVDGQSDGAVFITIQPVNDAPNAVDDGPFATVEDTVTIGNVLTNDTDPDGDTLQVVSFAIPGGAGPITAGGTGFIAGVGTLVIDANGDFTFTPVTDYNGAVPTITYTVTDGNGGSAAAFVTFDPVTGANDAPIAVDSAYTTAEEVLLAGNLITDDTGAGADSDIDGDALSLSGFSIPGEPGPFNFSTPVLIVGQGTLVVETDGSFTFDPAVDFNGTGPVISYTLTDGNGGSDTAVATITVTPVNDAPTGVSAPATTPEDQAVSGAVTMLDIDGDMPMATLAIAPANGVALVNPDGTWTYTPVADFNGNDAFTVTIDDGAGGSATVSVDITVTPVADVNDDQLTTPEDTPITANALTGAGTDGGLNGAGADTFEGPVVITAVTQGGNGSVTFTADGNVTYTPDANFNGVDSFTYTVTAAGTSETATVFVTVTPQNDAPAGTATPALTAEETPVSGVVVMTDIDGDIPTATLDTPANNGVVTVNPDGTWDYTPNVDFEGVDTFLVQVDDGGAVSTVLVEITVAGINDAPDAVSDSRIIFEDTPTALMIPLPTDVDDAPTALLSIVMQTPSSAQGTLTYVPDTTPGGTPVTVTSGMLLTNSELSTLVFTAQTGFLGAANPLVYITSDDEGATDAGSQATIAITVSDIPPVTTATEPPQTVDEDAVLTGSIDIVTGRPVTVTEVTPPTNGVLVITDPTTGDYTYTPNPDYNGPDQFTILVDDGQGSPVTVVVDVTVNPVDDAPVATVPVPFVTATDASTVTIDMSPFVTDVDSTLTWGATGLLPGIMIDPVTGVLTVDLPSDASQTGPHVITVTADDGINPPLVLTQEIIATNVPPVSLIAPSLTLSDGDPVNLSGAALFSDADGDTLVFTSPDLPIWLTLDPVTGVVTGTVPVGFEAGTIIVVTLVADDQQGGTATTTITLNPFAPSSFIENTGLPVDETDTDVAPPQATETPVVPFVVDAVNEIQDLNGTVALDGSEGVVLDAVDAIDALPSMIKADPADPEVQRAVEAIEALRKVHQEIAIENGSAFDTWDVEGLTGFSLRFGYGDSLDMPLDGEVIYEPGAGILGQLIIETYVRNRILFIDVNNSFDPNVQGIVSNYSVRMADGSEVPDWVRVVRDGFIVAERPANLLDLELTITAHMQDGSEISRSVRIDGPSGEIQPLTGGIGPSDPATPSGFDQQLRKMAKDL